MCHFISGLIDKETTLDHLNEIGHEYALTFDKCDNEFVKSQLEANEEYIVKRAKVCDCGTQLGLLSRTKSSDTTRVKKQEIDKLNKRGWSRKKN
jgi:hypothetical protein